ncbi:MAG: hypothetical protein ABIK86_07145 [candidate division WOR-3 bacterium]
MIDPKGRITNPFARQVEAMAEPTSFVLVPGPKRTVLALPDSAWEDLTRLIEESFGAESVVTRCWRAVSHQVRTDRLGRIVLPATLRRHAGIRSRIMVVGRNGYLELRRSPRAPKSKRTKTLASTAKRRPTSG